LTDSAGYYFDAMPILSDSAGILYVETFDCNNFIHRAVIVYNPVNITFTQDFQICTSATICQALFSFEPVPQGSPDSFQFTDLSTGDLISWYWDFGDGLSSMEQNPFHAYPGPGTYETCLTITGNECSDTYCNTIVISDTVYQQIYGQVFAGNFPLQSCMVMLFALNPGGTYSNFGDGFPVDSNGVYYFSLVPEGNYLIQAVPVDSSGYLPTYYGDVVNWQQASQIVVGIPVNPYNINLVQAGLMTPGPGSVTGKINNGSVVRSSVDNINMMLMDESLTAIGFNGVSSSGYFNFPSMDYGIYYLRAELSGVASDNMKIEITPEKPHLDLVLNYSENSVLAVEERIYSEGSLSVFPNPVSDRLTLSIDLLKTAGIDIKIYSPAGREVYHTVEHGNLGQNKFVVSTGSFPDGLYMLRVSSGNDIIFTGKVIKY
ncbi:MAG: T9SS type A sorting domain-containing protein, partial [Bacteroidales bacterium]|nr:T9SS type A sorting domain-containing protein [Bacteroidales bacterium]